MLPVPYNNDNYALKRALSSLSDATLARLDEFYQKSLGLENEYKAEALLLIEATLKFGFNADTKKDLTAFLLELGFKNSNVSKMIEASRFTLQLERQRSAASAWVKSLPVSTQYVLASCADPTFDKIWANDSQWGQQSLSKSQVELLKAKYEKASLPAQVKKMAKIFPGENDDLHQRLLKAKNLLADVPEVVLVIDQMLST